MKYIRTKDSAYEVTKDTKGTKFIVVGKNKTLLDYGTFINSDSDIIKQSDNLEELCDCFVCEGKRHIVWDKEQTIGITLEQIEFSYNVNYFKIYGAIWTDKGLIYVAKMTDKGGLELL